jgi:molecular chaperone DnaK
VPQIEVTFDIDASGILKVTAKDKATGKTQNITISGAVGLSDEEVKKMQEEAEKHKEEDEKKAEVIKARNAAENLVVTAEKALKDAGDKAPADVKEKVEEKIKSLREVMEKEDKDEIEKRTKELSEVLSSVGQAMYGKQEPEAKEEKKDEKVEEGEVVS